MMREEMSALANRKKKGLGQMIATDEPKEEMVEVEKPAVMAEGEKEVYPEEKKLGMMADKPVEEVVEGEEIAEDMSEEDEIIESAALGLDSPEMVMKEFAEMKPRTLAEKVKYAVAEKILARNA